MVLSAIIGRFLPFKRGLNRIEGGQSRDLSPLLPKTCLSRFKAEQSLLEKQETYVDLFPSGSSRLPQYYPLLLFVKDFQRVATFVPPVLSLCVATLPAVVPPPFISSFLVCCTEFPCHQNADEMLVSKLLMCIQDSWKLYFIGSGSWFKSSRTAELPGWLLPVWEPSDCGHVKFYQTSQY